MQFGQTGRVVDDFFVTGLRWSPVYLLAGRRPVLFEAGFTCAARLYESDIRLALGARQPEMLFLTHVHYDHCGAAAYLKHIFPSLKIAASRHSAEILARPGARKLMKSLSEHAVDLVARADDVDRKLLINAPFEPFDVDLELHEEEKIVLGDITVQVVPSPGHTRDQVSFYIPERRILIATEASGCMDRAGTYIPEFLVDYDLYMASLARLAALPVDILCQGHHFVYVGQDEVKAFFAKSIAAAEDFRKRVVQLLAENNGLIDPVVQQIKHEQYDTNFNVKQPEPAYLLNLRARVGHLAGKQEIGTTKA